MEQVNKVLWGSPAAANIWGVWLGILHGWALPLPGGCQCLWWSDHICRLGHLCLGKRKLPGVPDNQGMQCNKCVTAANSSHKTCMIKFILFFFICLNCTSFHNFHAIYVFTLRTCRFLPVSSVSVWWARKTLMSVHTGGGEYTQEEIKEQREGD